MDFTVFMPLIKDAFLIYFKQQYKKKIQDEFIKDVYLKIDRTKKPVPDNTVDIKSIDMIDEFEKVEVKEFFTEIDDAKDENEVLDIYSNFIKAKNTKIQELGDIYKTVYGQFIP